MKKITTKAWLTATIILSALLTNAQIIITSENVPVPGTNVLKGIDNLPVGLNPGTSGPGKTWDFSPLISEEIIGYSYLSPLSTPYPGYYPEANLAVHTSDTAYSYLYYDQDMFEMQGIVIFHQGNSYAFDYSPDLVLLNFPFTFGDEISQDYFFEWVYANTDDSVKVKTHVTKSLEADAFGTVTLPVGDFNAIRAKVTQENKDSMWAQVLGNWMLISTTITSSNQYDWYTDDPEVDISLVSFKYDETWSTLESVEFFRESYVGTGPEISNTEFNIYPNPASEMIFIEKAGKPGGRLQIFNSAGQLVFEEEMTSNKHEFYLERMVAGIYLCRVLDDYSGNAYQEKIVIR
jgi:hypothetical protein